MMMISSCVRIEGEIQDEEGGGRQKNVRKQESRSLFEQEEEEETSVRRFDSQDTDCMHQQQVHFSCGFPSDTTRDLRET